MDITSSSIVETSTVPISSSLPSSTVEPTNKINWPLIIGLSLLALALILCLALYCCYHFFGSGAHRRRQKKLNKLQDEFGWYQRNRKPYQKLLRGEQDRQQQRDSDITIIRDSLTPNSVIVTRVNYREKLLIDGQGNVSSKRSYTKSANSAQQNKVTQRTTSDETSNKNRMQISSILQDSPHSFTIPVSTSKAIKTNSVSVMKLTRFSKSSVEPLQPASAIPVEVQPTKNPHIDLSGLGKTRTRQPSVFKVSVSKIKRSSSISRINNTNQRPITVPSNNNLG